MAHYARYLKLVNPEKYGINAPPNFPTAHEEHSLKITEKEHQVLASANVVSSFTDQNNTEYVTFQYQPDELYNCEEQSYDLGESTLTYEIPVVHQEFGDNSTNTTTFVELQVVQEEETQCKATETGIIFRDITAGATRATMVAPQFSDTFTLLQPGPCRGGGSRFCPNIAEVTPKISPQ